MPRDWVWAAPVQDGDTLYAADISATSSRWVLPMARTPGGASTGRSHHGQPLVLPEACSSPRNQARCLLRPDRRKALDVSIGGQIYTTPVVSAT